MFLMLAKMRLKPEEKKRRLSPPLKEIKD